MNLALMVALLAFSAQDAKKPDDVLQKRDGGLLVGRIQKIEADTVEILVNGEKETRKVALKELMPYSVYRMRLDRVDKKSGAARYDLGEFCMAQGLFSTAVREFEEAELLDKSLAAKCKKRKEEAHSEDARSKFEEAKRLSLAKKWDEAVKLLHLLSDKFTDTPYAEQAKALLAKIAEEVKKENDDKKEQLAKKEADKTAKVEKAQEELDKQFVNRTVELLEEAQRSWAEGLDNEAKNLSRADRAWKSAEAALLNARRNTDQLLKQNDVDLIKKAKELDKQIDLLLVKTYYRLGRMWAVELSYPQALEWLNKGMRVPHDEQMDHLLNEITLTISQLKMRERGAGRGY